MVVEIVGSRTIKADGDVIVDYVGEKTVIYNSENTKHLIINPDEIVAVTIGKKIELK